MAIGSIGSNVTMQKPIERAPKAPPNVPTSAVKAAQSPSEETKETAAEARAEVAKGEEAVKNAQNVPPGVGRKLNVVG